jgi:hypothetical protein
MPNEPRKIFDLMDTETEPTDEQLAELMQYVGEAVRAKKKAASLQMQGPSRRDASTVAGG